MAEQMQPMPDVPKRCPQCHSPVAERFPHAVTYDCGFSLFNDGQPVTDDYPAECQRRRIKRLEKQLAAQAAEIERMGNKVTEALHALGSENNPKKALDILYAAYRRYHDELKGWVTNCE